MNNGTAWKRGEKLTRRVSREGQQVHCRHRRGNNPGVSPRRLDFEKVKNVYRQHGGKVNILTSKIHQKDALCKTNPTGFNRRAKQAGRIIGKRSHTEKNKPSQTRVPTNDRPFAGRSKPITLGNAYPSLSTSHTAKSTRCHKGRSDKVDQRLRASVATAVGKETEPETDQRQHTDGRSGINQSYAEKGGILGKRIKKAEPSVLKAIAYHKKQQTKYRKKRSSKKTRKRQRKASNSEVRTYRLQKRQESIIQTLRDMVDIKQFHNLLPDNVKLTEAEQLVLALGEKHLPVHAFRNNAQITFLHSSVDSFCRKLKLRVFFGDNGLTEKSKYYKRTNSKWIPTAESHLQKIAFKQIDMENQLGKLSVTEQSKRVRMRSTLSGLDKLILETLKTLKQRKDIIIKPADKNLGLTVMTTARYEQLVLAAINKDDYVSLPPEIIQNVTWAHLRLILSTAKLLYSNKRSKDDKQLTLQPLASYFLQLEKQPNLKIPTFYILPKLHKPGPLKGRPITASINSSTYYASKYIARVLEPLRSKFFQNCKRSSDVLVDLENQTFPSNSTIITADIKSLYPSLPINWVLEQIGQVTSHYLHILDLEGIPLPVFMKILHWVLTHNYYTFNGNIYLQSNGIAMGTPCAVAIVDLALSWYEFKNFPILPRDFLYRRFLDDMLLLGDAMVGHTLLTIIGSAPARIDASSISIGNSGVFLDLTLSLVPTKTSSPTSLTSHTSLTTDTEYRVTSRLYQKEISKFQYILWSSRHRQSVYDNLIISEMRRYRLTCTDDEDYKASVNLLQQRLLIRRYSDAFVYAAPNIASRLHLLGVARLIKTGKTQQQDSQIVAVGSSFDPRMVSYNWREIFRIPPILKDPYFNKVFDRLVIAIKHCSNVGRYVTRAKFDSPEPLLLDVCNSDARTHLENLNPF